MLQLHLQSLSITVVEVISQTPHWCRTSGSSTRKWSNGRTRVMTVLVPPWLSPRVASLWLHWIWRTSVDAMGVILWWNWTLGPFFMCHRWEACINSFSPHPVLKLRGLWIHCNHLVHKLLHLLKAPFLQCGKRTNLLENALQQTLPVKLWHKLLTFNYLSSQTMQFYIQSFLFLFKL